MDVVQEKCIAVTIFIVEIQIKRSVRKKFLSRNNKTEAGKVFITSVLQCRIEKALISCLVNMENSTYIPA